MEHDEMDVNRWVDDRLSALDPPGDWRPDSSAAFVKLQHRSAPPRRWWLWAAVSAAAAAACAGVFLMTAPPACANPLGCTPAGKPAGAPLEVNPGAQTGFDMRALKPDFKQSGSSSAPVTCELFTDYECPHCAVFYLETMPQLSARYIDTGKVRMIHRDFPLERHRYARLAALYADAAGEAGYYQAVANKLYRTQAVWSSDGDVDGQVAKVVPPPAMEKVRAQVRDDPSIDNSVKTDEAEAREKHIERTPTLICNGRVIGPNLSLTQIEAQIDPLVVQR
jgi:protein-disulfide isomerase